MKSTSHAIFRYFINYPLLITSRSLTLQSDIVETSCTHYPVLTTMLPLIDLHLNQQSERFAEFTLRRPKSFMDEDHFLLI